MTSRRALLTLTASQPAVFSEQPRTEGEHRTRAHPTGASLLGWAAQDYKFWSAPGKAEAVFHSGKIRFSDALPLAEDRAPAYPTPRLLVAPKHSPSDSGRLGDGVQVGRSGDDDGETQFEALPSQYVTRGGAIVKPDLGGRLRTATKDGKAEKGKLFGFQHIEPGARRWAATIEADDGVLTDEEWKSLLGQFDGSILHIGRGANVAYGGAYACEAEDGAGGDLWPVGSVATGLERLRVWALSDLALVDGHGAPSFVPSLRALGLGAEWRFDPLDSAITTRRYAPWNRTLAGRDVERQVVAAGSVFTYTRTPGGPAVATPNALVGFHREAGLGRVWVGPTLLSVARGAAPKIDERVIFPPPNAPSEKKPKDDPPMPGWLTALRKLNVLTGGGTAS